MGRIEVGPWAVWLKSGAGESHEHSDLLSVAIRYESNWVIGDPGNGSYNRSQEERDYFRTSLAHTVLRLERTDQREPHSRFRWRYHPIGRLGTPFTTAGYRVMWGTHDAYERLSPPRTILRACLVSETAIVVADWIDGDGAEWALSVPLGPRVEAQTADINQQTVDNPDPSSPTGGGGSQRSEGSEGVSSLEPRESRQAPPAQSRLILPEGIELGLILPGPAIAVRGSAHPYDGWWADDYDTVRASTRLEVTGDGAGPVVWGVWVGTPPEIMMTGGVLRVDGHELTAGRREKGVLELRLGESG